MAGPSRWESPILRRFLRFSVRHRVLIRGTCPLADHGSGIPAAGPGILTGILLGLARASGETAPLLFTSLGNQFMSTSIVAPIAAIPQLIYNDTIITQTPESLQMAWGAALVLVAIILVLNLGAALLSRKSRRLEGR